MRILDLQPVASRGGGTTSLIAHFDLELSEDVRLYGLRLLETPDGNRIVYAAQAGSRRSATFSRQLAEQITTAASTIYREAITADEHTICAA